MKRFLSLTVCFVLTAVLLLSSVSMAVAETITLTAGVYNVGKDIPAGEYEILCTEASDAYNDYLDLMKSLSGDDESLQALWSLYGGLVDEPTVTVTIRGTSGEKKKSFELEKNAKKVITLENDYSIKIEDGTCTLELKKELASTQSSSVSDRSSASSDEWTCPNCGNSATGNFCNNCGTARPEGSTNDSNSSENDDVIGTWHAVQVVYNGVTVDIAGTGMYVTMQLNANGSVTISSNDSEEEGTWTRNANTIVLTTDDSGTVNCTYEDEKITLKEQGNEIIFSKDLTTTTSTSLPSPITAASEDQFFGTWNMSRVAAQGIVLTPVEMAAMGSNEDITFTISRGEARADIITNGRSDYNKFNTTFSNGRLQLKSKINSVVLTVVLTDSGELMTTTTSDGVTRQIYFTKEGAEASSSVTESSTSEVPSESSAPTDTPVPTEAPDSEAKQSTIEKQFTFMPDRWNLYKATATSSTTWKLEKWTRWNASTDDFEFSYDVGTFDVNDSSYGFAWTDETQSAFFIILNDSRNSDLNQKRISFAINTEAATDVEQCTFTNDRWAQYKAFVLSPSTIKIECWGRWNASTDDFEHYYDIGVIDINDPTIGFAWADDAHTAFFVTMEDEQNDNWKRGSAKVGFAVDPASVPGATLFSFTNDRWAQYRAYALSSSLIKIECWGRWNASTDEFEHYYDIGVIKADDSSSDFVWTDDSHSAFFVTMEDELNDNWKRDAEKIGFSIDPETISGAAQYTYLYDNWNLYKAYVISPNIIKIVCWGRWNYNTDDFEHYYDVCTIQVDDPTNDFLWSNEAFTAFSVSIIDYNNDNLDSSTKVSFELDKEAGSVTTMATTVPKVTATPPSVTETPLPTSSEEDEKPSYSASDVHTSGKFQYILEGNKAQIIGYTGNDSSISISSSIDGHDITGIGARAFKDCTSLKTITIWADIVEFGDEAFMGCSNLKKISIPSSTKKIGKKAFKDCVKLENVTIWGDLDGIRESTFENCKVLKKISISSTAKFIDKRAFYGCEKLTSATIWGDPKYIGESAFEGCASLQKISIPSSTKTIEDCAFKGCSSMSSVTLWGDTNIGNYAFQGCSKISKISISSGTDYIGDYAFEGCTNLSKVTMWGRNTAIGVGAFDNCPKLSDPPKGSNSSDKQGKTTATPKTTSTPTPTPQTTSTPTPVPTSASSTKDTESRTESTALSGKTAHLEAGKYVGGDDIPAGKYILICKTGKKDSGIVWLAKDTDNLDKEYPSVLYEFVSKNEDRRFYLSIGEGYILNCPFACDLAQCDTISFENGTAQIETGRYTFSDDIPAGKYILVCDTDSKNSGIVWLAKDTDDLSNNYPSVLYEFIGKKETKKFYINAGSNFILCCPFPCSLIECNELTFENGSVTIEPGRYVFGDDLPAGKYTLTCNTTSQDSGIIWLAKDTDDLDNEYPSLLYEFVGKNDQDKFSINVKDGYILNCPFGCTLTKTQGVNFN